MDSSADTSDDQVASHDEYDIALDEGVDDDALKDDVTVKKFSITSYGADYTVDSLVKRMRAEAFTIPSFQRRFVWSQAHASKFIESLLMGLPVPGIFLYKDSSTNKHLVIDGQQRLRTLQAFYDGVFGEKKFRLINVREPWAGCTYDDLDPSDKLKLDDSIVHATIFTQDEPSDVLDSVYFVFERINSGGIRLSPQEIRNCIAIGPFTDMVKSLNVDQGWRKLFGGPENKRAKDEELIVRFFAMFDCWEGYTRPLASFLNSYSVKMNGEDASELKRRGNIFIETVQVVNESLDGRAFRPERNLNAAVFDAVMVGLARRIEGGPKPNADAVSAAYDNLMASEDFQRAWVRATADQESVKSRMAAAIKAFAAI